jgi:hypothetical protein
MKKAHAPRERGCVGQRNPVRSCPSRANRLFFMILPWDEEEGKRQVPRPAPEARSGPLGFSAGMLLIDQPRSDTLRSSLLVKGGGSRIGHGGPRFANLRQAGGFLVAPGLPSGDRTSGDGSPPRLSTICGHECRVPGCFGGRSAGGQEERTPVDATMAPTLGDPPTGSSPGFSAAAEAVVPGRRGRRRARSARNSRSMWMDSVEARERPVASNGRAVPRPVGSPARV